MSSLPPTKEGLDCYKAIFKAEADLIEVESAVAIARRSLAKMHRAFDVLRESLGRDLPSKEETKAMKIAAKLKLEEDSE